MSFRNVRLAAYEKPIFAGTAPETDGTVVPAEESVHHGSVDLAETGTFRVVLLPARPSVLEDAGLQASGALDPATGWALLSAETGCYVWKYAQDDPSPNTLFFSYENEERGLATFVAPAQSEQEPGLLTVSMSGTITYWESVGGAVADGLFQSGNSSSVELRLSSSDHVTHLTTVDPLGAVIATAGGRLYFVRLRDPFGKQTLHVAPMKGRHSGFLSTISDSLFTATWQRGVVCIAPGPLLDGAGRQVFIVNNQGSIALWQCGTNGTVSMLTQADLGSRICEEISVLYPQASNTFLVHDLVSRSSGSAFLLASFHPNSLETFYLLVSLRIELRDIPTFDVVSTHRLQSYTTENTSRPHLLLPEPESVIYIVFENAIVLVDSTNKSTAENARWEDVLFLKENVVVYSSAAVENGIVMEANQGMMCVKLKTSSTATEVALPSVGPIRARLEQAVFFAGRSNPLDFALGAKRAYNENKLNAAVISLVTEIALGKTKYMPPLLSSVGEYLELRRKYLAKLAKYIRANYDVDSNVLLYIQDTLQKIACAASLWTQIDGDQTLANTVQGIVKTDLHEWFRSHVLNIPSVIVALSTSEKNIAAVIISLQAADRATEHLSLLNMYNYDGTKCPWLASDEIFAVLERLAHLAGSIKDNVLVVSLVELLCGTSAARCEWLRKQDPRGSAEVQAKTAEAQSKLLGLLSARGLTEDALKIAERFSILEPLATLLSDEWLGTVDEGVSATNPHIQKLYLFIDRFGYDFAKILFSQLVEQKKVKALVSGFLPTYKDYVERYMRSDATRLLKVSWALQIKDGKSIAAAKTLEAATGNEKHSIPNGQILAGLTKLAGLYTSQQSLVQSADQKLATFNAQPLLRDQLTGFGKSVLNIVHRSGVSQILEHQAGGNTLKKDILATGPTLDLLTFLPTDSATSTYNYAAAFAILASLKPSGLTTARTHLVYQQLILHTDWSAVWDFMAEKTVSEWETWIADTTLYKTFAAGPLSVENRVWEGVREPSSWQVATDDGTLKQLYPWASSATISAISSDFCQFNQQIKELLDRQGDISRWIIAIASKAQQSHVSDNKQNNSMELD